MLEKSRIYCEVLTVRRNAKYSACNEAMHFVPSPRPPSLCVFELCTYAEIKMNCLYLQGKRLECLNELDAGKEN
jgi:hypothetical protein